MKIELLNRIYRFDSKYTSSEEYSMVLKLDVREQQDIYEFVKSLRGGEIKDMVSIFIMTDYEISNFNKFSELTGISYKITDITSDVILGDYDSNNHSITEEIISEFLKDNLTTDIILDKINIKGIESLSKIDLEILES
jgi:hypothetical protein